MCYLTNYEVTSRYRFLTVVTSPWRRLRLTLMGFLVACQERDKIQRALKTPGRKEQTKTPICSQWWPLHKGKALFAQMQLWFLRTEEVERAAQASYSPMIIGKHKIEAFSPLPSYNRQGLKEKWSFFPRSAGNLDGKLLSLRQRIVIVQWIFLPRIALIACSVLDPRGLLISSVYCGGKSTA